MYKFLKPKFPISGYNSVFLPPGTGRVTFACDFLWPVSEKGKGIGEGHNDSPDSGIFSDSFA